MRSSFGPLLASMAILAPVGVTAAEIDGAPVNLMGTELFQTAQAGGSGAGSGSGGTSGSGSSGAGSGSSGKDSGSMGLGDSSSGKSGSNGLNPRIGPGSSPNPSTGPADDMAKQRDEDKRLRDKGRAKGSAP